jgi:hypothetical protein
MSTKKDGSKYSDFLKAVKDWKMTGKDCCRHPWGNGGVAPPQGRALDAALGSSWLMDKDCLHKVCAGSGQPV